MSARALNPALLASIAGTPGLETVAEEAASRIQAALEKVAAG